jgi:DNA-binding GntR family transcriptional regulator
MKASDLQLIRAPSLADQVIDAIMDSIASGALEPGQRLLEVELAQRLAVSRVPVREALKTLVAQGILETSPHRGTRIVALEPRKIDHISEVRAALETLAARDARRAYAAQPGLLGRLDAIIDVMAHAARDQDRLGLSKADIAFHREICRTSGNDIVPTLWETLARHILIIFGREALAIRDLKRVVDQHRALRTAIALGDEPLDALIEQHIMGLRRGPRGPADPPSSRTVPTLTKV